MEKAPISAAMIPDAMKTSTITIYQYDNKVMQGSFYNLYYGEEIRFDNLMQLLLLMEGMMDEIRYPEATMNNRLVYQKREISHTALAGNLLPEETHGALETFHVRVIFRQNASWQGSVSWRKGKQTQSFRSALELFKLMDNILTEYTEELPKTI